MDPKDLIAIPISILALVISLVNLYLSQLRKGALAIVAGEHMNVCHFDEGNCGVTIPISITNTGARAATVRRLALLIQVRGSAEGYLLEPLFYQRIDESGNFQHDSQPMPIAVVARGVETRQVLFRSSIEPPTEFQLTRSGDYECTVLAWTESSAEPQSADKFEVKISETEAAILSARLQSRESLTVRLRQSDWRKWAAHRLTDLEVNALRQRHSL